MAQPDLEKFDQRGLLMAVAGTSLLANTHGIQLLDGSSGREFDKGERNIDRTHLGGRPFYKKNKRAFVQGGIEITPPVQPGHATDGKPPYAICLLASAMAEVLTVAARKTRYNPVSQAMAMADAIWYHSKTYLEVTSARANMSGFKAEIGMPIMVEQFRAQGKYTVVSQDDLPDIDFSDYPKPTVCSDENSVLVIETVDGVDVNLELWGKLLKIDYGNGVATKEYTGHKEQGISKRDPTFTFRFAKPDLDDFNPQTVSDDEVIVTGYWKTSEPDGRYTKIGFRGQIENVTDVDIEGDFGYECTGPCIPSDAGGDEHYLEFGDDTFHINGDATGTEGAEGSPYSFTGYSLSGVYTAPVTWSVSAGALPTGCTLNTSTGAITGTASADGTFTFTLTATDSTSGTAKVATKADTITIN